MDPFLFLFLWICALGVNILIFTYFSAKHNSPSYLIGSIAAYLVLANVLSYKLIQLFSFTVPAGIITYSMIFLINDILSEKFGKNKAKEGVIMGVIMNVMFIISIYLSVISPPLPTEQGLEKAKYFQEVFSLTGRIIFASLIAFFLSQSFNVLCFHFLKEKTSGKWLWLRNNVSTIISQLIDTIVFILIAFYGVFPQNLVFKMIISQYIIKIIIALCDTPFIYLASYSFDYFSSYSKSRTLKEKEKKKK